MQQEQQQQATLQQKSSDFTTQKEGPPLSAIPDLHDKANPFTQFYAQLLHQGNMLADTVRTAAYQEAIFANSETDFKDKAVLDVGTGTGILAFFAIQAGARIVYAVEASDSAKTAQILADANGFTDKIRIIKGKIEEIADLPEKVDIIISEPIGFMLVHERMLESYVVARDRFLKPDGVMFPTTGSMVFAPYTDFSLHKEQEEKLRFWTDKNFFGIDLSPVIEQACDEYFTQAVVGSFSADSLLSSYRTVHRIDFSHVSLEELKQFDVPFSFTIDKTGIIHGIAGWFDIVFAGHTQSITLSTAPDCPTTHWYQCRMMFKDTLAVNKGQVVSGTLRFHANDKFSYTILISATLNGTGIRTEGVCNLHDQMYHYLHQ